MSIRIAVLKEKSLGERRVAIVPEVAAKIVQAGFSIALESGAGMSASFPDEAYQKTGVEIGTDSKTVLKDANCVLAVQMPRDEELSELKEKAILIAFLSPHRHAEQITKLKDKKVIAIAMEQIPRITRAQSMDALSSQATVAGYKAVLIAANLCGRFFPMLTTAAGTIRPSKLLILGAGVAGLQACATAKRLGAIVEAYDVRHAVKEQVESLGARFLEIELDAQAKGGYARELTAEEKKREQEMLSTHIQYADCIIATAQIPGKPAPRLISEETVLKMKTGAVVVDIAAESGGNCAATKAGETLSKNGVTICGPINLPSGLPLHASEMYAKNLFNLLMFLTKEGKSLELNFNDEIISASLVTGRFS